MLTNIGNSVNWILKGVITIQKGGKLFLPFHKQFKLKESINFTLFKLKSDGGSD
jgi:hypothetical protein